MQKEDKVALVVIGLILGAISVGGMFALKWLLVNVVGAVDFGMSGVGWRSAFFWSIGLSFFFILIFALVAGDGLLSELTVMMVSFFVMIAFFTVTIAMIF